MADMNAKFIVSLIDKLTPVARKVAQSMRSMQDAARAANGAQGGRGAVNALEAQGRAIDRVKRKYAEMVAAAQMAGPALAKSAAHFQQAFAGLGPQGLATKTLVAGGMGVAGAGLFNRMLLRPTADLERYQIQMEGIFRGNKAAATDAMGWVKDFAYNTPLELTDVMDSFIMLRNYGLDPMNGSLQAITDTNSLYGGSAERQQRIILAIGQAWSKQKLQGEEIRQLVEAGVPVWDMLAEATGKSVPVLQELSSEGALGRDVMTKLLVAMAENSKGASERLSKSWDGMLANMVDAWKLFAADVANSGPFQYLKDQASGFLDMVKRMKADGSLAKLAEEWGGKVLQGLKDGAAIIRELASAIGVISRAVSGIADMAGGYKNLLLIAAGIWAFNRAVSLAAGIWSLAKGLGLLFGLVRAAPAAGALTALASGITGVGAAAAGAGAFGTFVANLGKYAALAGRLAGPAGIIAGVAYAANEYSQTDDYRAQLRKYMPEGQQKALVSHFGAVPAPVVPQAPTQWGAAMNRPQTTAAGASQWGVPLAPAAKTTAAPVKQETNTTIHVNVGGIRVDGGTAASVGNGLAGAIRNALHDGVAGR